MTAGPGPGSRTGGSGATHRAIPGAALALLTLAAASLAGCGSDSPGGDATTVRDSAGVRIVENGAAAARDTWSLGREPVTEIGRVQGPEEYRFDRIRDVERTSDGRIVVANFGDASLKLYGADGGHLRTAGGKGGGPGEFRYLSDLDLLAGDSIVAWDLRLERLSIFSPTGEFVRSRPLRPPQEAGVLTFVGLTGGGTPVLYGATSAPAEGGSFRRDLLVHRYDDGRAPGPRIARVPGDEQFRWDYEMRGKQAFLILPYPFGTSTSLAVGEERVCVTTGGAYEVRCHGLAGELRTVVRQRHDRPTVAEEDVDRFVEDVVSGIERKPFRERAEEAYRGLEGMPARRPSVDRLRIDERGNLWVREYRPRYEEGDRTWAVFGPDGRREATVGVPSGFEPRAIGDTLVVGRWEDELGVEYVRLYRLRK